MTWTACSARVASPGRRRAACPGSGRRRGAGAGKRARPAGVRWARYAGAWWLRNGGNGSRRSSRRPERRPHHRPEQPFPARRRQTLTGPCPAPATGAAHPQSTHARRNAPGRPRPTGCHPWSCRTMPSGRPRARSGGARGVAECWDVGGTRHAALPCSCTPRFLVPGPLRQCAGRCRPARGPALSRPGHTYPYGWSVIPARKSGRRRSAVRARHSTACSCANGNQSTSPGHLPGTSPYPAVILSGRLRS